MSIGKDVLIQRFQRLQLSSMNSRLTVVKEEEKAPKEYSRYGVRRDNVDGNPMLIVTESRYRIEDHVKYINANNVVKLQYSGHVKSKSGEDVTNVYLSFHDRMRSRSLEIHGDVKSVSKWFVTFMESHGLRIGEERYAINNDVMDFLRLLTKNKMIHISQLPPPEAPLEMQMKITKLINKMRV